jgi:hypothetical protein
MPMLILCLEKLAVRGGQRREGGMSFSSSLTGSVPRITQAGSAVIHTPDKSGLAFASRGAGADRSTPPLAVLGARGLGYVNHCAANDPDDPAHDDDQQNRYHSRPQVGRRHADVFHVQSCGRHPILNDGHRFFAYSAFEKD